MLAHGVVAGAQRVVEHDDTRRAAFGFHQVFHFRVIDAPHFGFVEEVGDPGVVAHEPEALALQLEFRAMQAPVVNHNLVWIDGAGALVALAGAGRLGEDFAAVVNKVIERRLDFRNSLRRGTPFEDLIHCRLLAARRVCHASPAT